LVSFPSVDFCRRYRNNNNAMVCKHKTISKSCIRRDDVVVLVRDDDDVTVDNIAVSASAEE
jgi:hypothetical protein